MEFTHVSEKNVEELDSEIEEENLKKVEAALFLSGRLMTLQELVGLTGVNPILLRKVLSDLEDKYKNFGINIVKQNDSWKMDISENFTWMVNRLASGSSEFSRAEQETLAIIAYKQPVKQSVIIKIRGNKGYDHVKRFVEHGFLNKKRTGHTSELSLTEKFYEYFHLSKGDKIKDFGGGE